MLGLEILAIKLHFGKRFPGKIKIKIRSFWGVSIKNSRSFDSMVMVVDSRFNIIYIISLLVYYTRSGKSGLVNKFLVSIVIHLLLLKKPYFISVKHFSRSG